jgi:hypothetical protein
MNKNILKKSFRLLKDDNLKLKMIKNENSKISCNENKIIQQLIPAYLYD